MENASGTDADLWLVKLETGELTARVEDPALNPGLTTRGWQVGVEPVRWTNDYLFLPLHGADETGVLLVVNNAGVRQDSRVVTGGKGFQVSVDSIVAPLPDTVLRDATRSGACRDRGWCRADHPSAVGGPPRGWRAPHQLGRTRRAGLACSIWGGSSCSFADHGGPLASKLVVTR